MGGGRSLRELVTDLKVRPHLTEAVVQPERGEQQITAELSGDNLPRDRREAERHRHETFDQNAFRRREKAVEDPRRELQCGQCKVQQAEQPELLTLGQQKVPNRQHEYAEKQIPRRTGPHATAEFPVRGNVPEDTAGFIARRLLVHQDPVYTPMDMNRNGAIVRG